MLLVVVDADPVRVAINKGYSCSGDLTEILRRLREYPDIVVVADRVPGPHYLADMPFRGVSLYDLRKALAQSSGEAVFRYVKTIEALKRWKRAFGEDEPRGSTAKEVSALVPSNVRRGCDGWRALALRAARHPGTQRASKEFWRMPGRKGAYGL